MRARGEDQLRAEIVKRALEPDRIAVRIEQALDAPVEESELLPDPGPDRLQGLGLRGAPPLPRRRDEQLGEGALLREGPAPGGVERVDLRPGRLGDLLVDDHVAHGAGRVGEAADLETARGGDLHRLLRELEPWLPGPAGLAAPRP